MKEERAAEKQKEREKKLVSGVMLKHQEIAQPLYFHQNNSRHQCFNLPSLSSIEARTVKN